MQRKTVICIVKFLAIIFLYAIFFAIVYSSVNTSHSGHSIAPEVFYDAAVILLVLAPLTILYHTISFFIAWGIIAGWRKGILWIITYAITLFALIFFSRSNFGVCAVLLGFVLPIIIFTLFQYFMLTVTGKRRFSICIIIQAIFYFGYMTFNPIDQIGARLGNPIAQYNMGLSYIKGSFKYSSTHNRSQAIYWLLESAKQGNLEAQKKLTDCYVDLADCYMEGYYIEKDEYEAVKWYRKAAEQGHSGAQNNLGVCYSNGDGVEKDEKEAAKWYRKAAEQGEIHAQSNLASRYEYGSGVEKDLAEAVKWYQKAADQGDRGAKNSVDRLEQYKRGNDVKEALGFL